MSIGVENPIWRSARHDGRQRGSSSINARRRPCAEPGSAICAGGAAARTAPPAKMPSASMVLRDRQAGSHRCGRRPRRRQFSPRSSKGDLKPDDRVIVSEQRAAMADKPPLRVCGFDMEAGGKALNQHVGTVIRVKGFRGLYHVGDMMCMRSNNVQPDRRAREFRRHHGIVRIGQVDADVDSRLSRRPSNGHYFSKASTVAHLGENGGCAASA